LGGEPWPYLIANRRMPASIPENCEGVIFMAFFLLGLIGWALFYPRLDGYLTSKKI